MERYRFGQARPALRHGARRPRGLFREHRVQRVREGARRGRRHQGARGSGRRPRSPARSWTGWWRTRRAAAPPGSCGWWSRRSGGPLAGGEVPRPAGRSRASSTHGRRRRRSGVHRRRPRTPGERRARRRSPRPRGPARPGPQEMGVLLDTSTRRCSIGARRRSAGSPTTTRSPRRSPTTSRPDREGPRIRPRAERVRDRRRQHPYPRPGRYSAASSKRWGCPRRDRGEVRSSCPCFRFGAPPHGGIAMGLDRLAMVLAGKDAIRDMIAFPKSQSGSDPFTGRPRRSTRPSSVSWASGSCMTRRARGRGLSDGRCAARGAHAAAHVRGVRRPGASGGPGRSLTNVERGGSLPSIDPVGPCGHGQDDARAPARRRGRRRAHAALGGDSRRRRREEGDGGRPRAGCSARCCSWTRCTGGRRPSRTCCCPRVEEGTITLIGATTENPYFS